MKNHKILMLIICLGMMSFENDHSLSPKETFIAPDVESCNLQNDTWQDGEELTYKLYYNWNFVWLSAGEATLKITDDGNQFNIKAFGDTYESYEWFFQVHDRYEAWVDKSTLLPNYTERSVHEGGYRIFERVSYDQGAKQMKVWRAKKRGDKENQTNHAVKNCVHDVLSIMYALRNIDFKKLGYGAKVPFQVFMDQEEFPLSLKYMGQIDKKRIHSLGKFAVMEFEPSLISGTVFTADAKMKVWVSDDRNRIPLQIESPVSVGSVKAVLKSYKGLRYPFDSKR